MADQRTIKFTLVVDGNGVVREVQTTGAAFTAMGSAAQAAAGQTQQSLSQVERAAKSAQASVENQKAAHQQAAAAATQEQVAHREAAAAKRAAVQASDAFVNSLRDQVATLGMSRTELLAYRAAQLGVAAEAAPMIARLGQADQVTGKYGMTAGQLSQAMRMLPMQMTDVATSLASGMPIWMVAIQQGGQLRDSFGGIRPMFSALLSLITPVSLAIGGLAAVAGLTAAAFVQGQREASAYSQALILTGNYAGTTSGQLGDMARQMAGVNGTQAAHASALAEVAGSGRIAGGVMREVAAAAVAMESATGTAVKASVAEFVRLGEEPAKASAKLNEQYHYLTASIYAQIAALERAGKTDEAAELAQRTYANAMQERVEKVRQSLGWLETSWSSLGRAAKQAWDYMLNLGRDTSLSEQYAAQAQKVAKAYLDLAEAQKNGRLAQLTADRKQLFEVEKAALEQLGARLKLDQVAGEAQGRLASANERAIAAQQAIDASTQRYATSQQKLNLELAATKRFYDDIRAVNPNDERLKGEEAMYARIRASFKDLGAAAKKELGEAAKAVEAYRNLVADLAGKDSGLNTDFNEKLEVLRKGWVANAASATGAAKATDEYRAAVQALIAQQPFAQKAAADQKKWQDEQDAQRKKAAKEATDAVEEYLDARLKAAGIAAESAETALKAAQAEYDQYGKSKTAIAELTLVRLREKQAAEPDPRIKASIQREIEAQEKLIALLRRGEARDLSAQAAQEATAAWQAFADDIDRELTGSLQRAFEAGKGFGESFFTSLKNMAKTAAIKVAVQFVSGGSSTGGTIVNLLNGGSGSGGGVLGAVNSGSSLINLGTAGAGIWGSSAAYGAALGTTSIGAGSQAAMLASQTGVFGAEGLGMTAAAAGGTAGGAMSAVAAAAPYIAAVLAVYALAEKYTKGETRSGGQYGVGVTPAGTYDSYATLLSGPSGGEIQGDQVKAAINATVAGINSTLKAVGSAASLTGFQAALESSGNGRGGVYAGGTLSTGATFGELGLGGGRSNYNGTLYESTSATSLDSATALKNFTTDLLQATVQALQAATDIPKTISDMLAGVDAESLSAEAAGALLANVNAMAAFSSAVSALPFENLKNLSFAAADSLFKLMGGVEGLNAALGSYFENYYSEAERQQQSVANVQRVFTELGLTMPALTQSGEAARAQFRALVEAQDLNTEQGREAYAALLGVSAAFADLTPLGVEVAASVDAVTGEVRALSQTMVELGREHTSLQDQYDRLTMSQADYRAKTVAGYTDEEKAAAAANYVLSDQIAMLQEVARLGQQRTALETQLLQVQGNTAALRERELAAMPESLRALQERIYLLTDEAAATQEAARQAQEVASARQAMAQQLATLEMQLLQAEGNTAEIRRREIEVLDPSLRGIQELIYARQDEAAAAQQAASDRTARAQQLAALERQLLEAQGNTAEIRRRELEALDPSARAIQELIYARQDEAAAAQQAASDRTARAQQLAALERQLLEAQGNTAEIRRRELEALDPSARAIQELIYARQDEAAAAQQAAAAVQQAAQQAATAVQEAAQRASAVLQERNGLETQWLQLIGDTATLRQRELAAIDPSNRALQEAIWARQDQVAADQAAAQAAQESARQAEAAAQAQAQAAAEAARAVQQAVEQIAAERLGLTKRLLQLQGNTAALREMELAELDASNRALQEQIWALEDQQAALSSVSSATETVTNQADALVAAWQSVGDSIAEEVRRIRGLVGGESQASLASLQAQFAVATAQARAGDQEAAKGLPALSQAVLQMAEATAANAVDLRRLQGSVAASLEGTLGVLGNVGYVPRFAAGGDFAGGWRLVGENGPELEATGSSRIFNVAQTRSILAGAGDRAELQQLVAQGEDLLRALTQVVVNSGRMARNLANVTSEAGDSLAISQRADDLLQVAP